MPAPGTPPNPTGYAREIARLLDELDLDTIAVCGNSIGGWTALELAKLGRASCVVALSPAGLWRRESRYRRFRFLTDHYFIRLTPPLTRSALRTLIGRRLILGDVLDQPAKPTDADAFRFAEDFAAVKELPAHLKAWRGQRFEGGASLEIPVTIAWGARDRLMPPSRRAGEEELPPEARWIEVPGCGHVMAWDAPGLVAATILQAAHAGGSSDRQTSLPSPNVAHTSGTPGR
jgi:pimeloyl-ACP methyl ester carboxylesterase